MQDRKLILRKTDLLIFVVLAIMHNVFYLAPDSIGPLNYFDIQFLICAAIIFWHFLKWRINFFCGSFKSLVLCVPLLIVFSSLAAAINYGQGIVAGIATQRAWLIVVLMYFVFISLMNKNRIDLDGLIKILYFIVTIELVIYFVQFLVGDSHMFLNVNHNFRYGTLRLYCNTNYMVMVALVAVDRVLRKKQVWTNIAYIVAIVMYYILVNKGRSATFSLLIGLGVVLLLSKNVSKVYKYLIVIVVAIVGIRYLATSQVVQDFINVIFNHASDGTYQVRLSSRTFYIDKWTSSPIAFLFGYGYANSGIAASTIATGVTQGYLYADNGVYAFLSCYGLVGLIWLAAYFVMFGKKAWALLKRHDAILIARFAMMVVTIQVAINYFYSYYSFDMILVLFFMELALKDSSAKDEYALGVPSRGVPQGIIDGRESI